MRQSRYSDLLPAYNTIAYLEGQARLTSDGVAVDGSLLRPGKTIITTGSSPAVPPIPGIEDLPYLTSTTAMALEELPESLLVIGMGCAARSLCTVMTFFCSDAHLDRWRGANYPDLDGIRLSIDEAFQAGKAIFTPMLAGT